MTKPQINSFNPKKLIPPIQPQLNKSSSDKSIKGFFLLNPHSKDLSNKKIKSKQDLMNDPNIYSNNSSLIFHKYSQENKISFSRNIRSNNYNQKLKTSFQFMKSNLSKNGVKRMFLDKHQIKIDNLDNENTFSDGFLNLIKNSPKISRRFIPLLQHPKMKYINIVSMNNSLQKDKSKSNVKFSKKSMQLNASMENFSTNISKIRKNESASPINNNIWNHNQCNNISFEDVEGPEEMHFIFVKLFQKKKAFYKKLTKKNENGKKISKISDIKGSENYFGKNDKQNIEIFAFE